MGRIGQKAWNKGLHIRFGGHNGLFGSDNPNYKGGSITAQGYRQICVNGQRRLEHRYFMEIKLGRKLKRSEHVHHINSNKLDNRLANLELIDARYHGRISANQRWSLSHGV